jgi:hypothetical protein
MQGGSIEQTVSARSAVTLMPTIVPGLPDNKRHRFRSTERQADDAVLGVRYNVLMLRWMESMAYRNSVAFEVWHISPRTELHDAIYDRLVERLADYTQRGVVAWEHYDEETAQQILLGSPHIDVLYDGNHDRVDRRWKYRGYRVPTGGTP